MKLTDSQYPPDDGMKLIVWLIAFCVFVMGVLTGIFIAAFTL